MNALNLGLRFLLELAAFGGFALLTWQLSNGWWRYLAVFVVLAVLMSLWGVFAVPDDPSRSGNAPIPILGLLRLGLELAILLGGGVALFLAEQKAASTVIFVLVLLHYAFSTERVAWLLQQ